MLRACRQAISKRIHVTMYGNGESILKEGAGRKGSPMYAGFLVLCLLPLLPAVHAAQHPADLSCYPRAVLADVYRSLHDAIKEHVIGCDSDVKHVELLGLGKPLKYDNFNPGKRKLPLTISQLGTLPISVVENAQPIVDKIFPTGDMIKSSPKNTKAQNDYNFASLSSTFSYILRHMMVKPKNFTSDNVLKAKYYLQELVPNSEQVLNKDAPSLPRLLLYDYYRSRYLQVSGQRDSQIDKNRLKLTQTMFETWGQKELPSLMSDVDAAYMKWQVLGYKTEVENQLQYFDVDRQEDKLMKTKALFRSAARSSERDPHVTVYPFTFIPDDWYQTLKSSISESADELRYRKSLFETEQALLNASRNELSNITSEDIKYTLELINSSIADLDTKVNNAVDKLLQYEIECFTSVNASACELIVNGHTAFKQILDKIAEHFEQASYLQSLLNRRNESLSVIDQKLQSTATQIKVLDSKIKTAELKQIQKDMDLSSNNNIETRSCPEEGNIHFTFDTENTVLDSYLCNDDAAEDGKGENLPYCRDERIPVNVSQSMLWNVASCSVDNQLNAFGLHDNFIQLMNLAQAKITASLSKVDIHRPWFDETIFRDWEHFTLKKGRGVVSPGPLEPERYYQEVVRNGDYLMPQFTSAFILASDVKVYFPGLGIWNDTDVDDHTNSAVNILMKYTYAPNLEGGYGPFSFVPADGAINNVHTFRVERSRGGILITVPGAQIIGYITTVISKFPDNQTIPNNSTPCQEPPPLRHHENDPPPEENIKRRRRSTDEAKKDARQGFDMLQLAKSLFSEKLSESDSFLHKNGFVTPFQSVHRLMEEVATSKDKVVEFMETLNYDRKEARPLALNQRDPASVYHNGTASKSQQFITSR